MKSCLDKYLSSIGLTTGVIGALFIAMNMNMFIIGYTLFLISSVAWVIYAFRTSQTNLMILNTVFGIINAIGLYNFS